MFIYVGATEVASEEFDSDEDGERAPSDVDGGPAPAWIAAAGRHAKFAFFLMGCGAVFLLAMLKLQGFER